MSVLAELALVAIGAAIVNNVVLITASKTSSFIILFFSFIKNLHSIFSRTIRYLTEGRWQ